MLSNPHAPEAKVDPRAPMPAALITSGGKPHVGMETEIGPITRLDYDPLQSPKTHACLAEQVIGGPESGRDMRLRIHRSEIEPLLSPVQAAIIGWTCVVPACVLVVRTYRDPGGHVWQLLGIEGAPALPAGPALPTMYRNWSPGEPVRLGMRYRPPERQKLIGERRVGGDRDQRLYLAATELDRWTALADARGYIAFDRVGIKLRLHDEYGKWTYGCLSVLHDPPRPLGEGA